MPPKWDPRVGPKGKFKPEQWDEMVNDMYAWGKELETWGKRVRRDILALEAQRDLLAEKLGMSETDRNQAFNKLAGEAHKKVGLPGNYPGGDPEDPPPPPWRKR